ncbi:hypothetical protein ACIP9E_29430 [Micromonospora chalcea]
MHPPVPQWRLPTPPVRQRQALRDVRQCHRMRRALFRRRRLG